MKHHSPNTEPHARTPGSNELKWIRGFLEKTGAAHLRARKEGTSIVLQSGPPHDLINHVKFKRQNSSLWNLCVATHTGEWENTPYEATCENLMYIVVQNFEWLLTDTQKGV